MQDSRAGVGAETVQEARVRIAKDRAWSFGVLSKIAYTKGKMVVKQNEKWRLLGIYS